MSGFMKSLFLISILILLVFNLTYGANSDRYNDFYKRRITLQRQEEARELGRKKFVEDQKKADERFEKLEAEFVRKKKDQNQELKDQFAEKWMQEQTTLHEEKLERAREQYLSKIKKNSKFQIPESDEFDVK
jgi:TRAP-type C4-dicarboxylate transport system substrate-binding protein